MITKQKYIEYLISTPVNYTCSNLAAHLEKVSHDAVSDYLRRDKLTARGLWELVQPLLNDSPQAYLLVDDSVQAKRYSHKIELVKRQYSGNEHGLVKGINDWSISSIAMAQTTTQLITVFMPLTTTAKPRTTIFEKWSWPR